MDERRCIRGSSVNVCSSVNVHVDMDDIGRQIIRRLWAE
jgi:hypothetical protein